MGLPAQAWSHGQKSRNVTLEAVEASGSSGARRDSTTRVGRYSERGYRLRPVYWMRTVVLHARGCVYKCLRLSQANYTIEIIYCMFVSRPFTITLASSTDLHVIAIQHNTEVPRSSIIRTMLPDMPTRLSISAGNCQVPMLFPSQPVQRSLLALPPELRPHIYDHVLYDAGELHYVER
jgi:hypothetical protein